MYLYCVIFILIFIIAIIICLMIEKNKEYAFNISKKNDKIKEITKKCEFYKEKCENLNIIIGMNEKTDKDKILKALKKPQYTPIYKGKKALIGDYFKPSYMQTKLALESLGFDVTIALTSEDVIKRIKNREKYDIIFSNNIYPDGTGPECLAKLKEIEGFNIPVVIHTITKHARHHFINEIGLMITLKNQ